MPMAANEIERLIRDAIPDAEVTITDLAGDGDHYSARVVSATFAGLNRVRQHQRVYAALGQRMGNELHALQLTTAAPKEMISDGS
jgi:stress-induced morphogen